MAITACSAKFCRSTICRSENGRTSRRQMMKMGADYFLSKTEDFDRLRRIMRGLACPQDLGED